MGGRGTYAVGNNVDYTYEVDKTFSEDGKINDVKILKPMDKTKSLKLPEESHTAGNSYVLLDKNGVFHQFRKYDENHRVILEIGYHQEASLGKGKVLHVHVHNIPGVEGHNSAKKEIIGPGNQYYEKYKKLFKGVKLWREILWVSL